MSRFDCIKIFLTKSWPFFNLFSGMANTGWQVCIINSFHRIQAINLKLCTVKSDILWI